MVLTQLLGAPLALPTFMDWLLLSLAKLVPIGMSILGLWIKAFDKDERLRRPGRYMILAIAATGLFVYFSSEVDSQNRSLASAQEQQETLYKQMVLLDEVRPGDVFVIVSSELWTEVRQE